MMPVIRREISAIDPSVPLSEDYPLESRVAFTFAHVRMAMTVLVSFGVLAMMLTAIGSYGWSRSRPACAVAKSQFDWPWVHGPIRFVGSSSATV